jgi:phosphoribosylaminoimidazole (AIR) synthetase
MVLQMFEQALALPPDKLTLTTSTSVTIIVVAVAVAVVAVEIVMPLEIHQADTDLILLVARQGVHSNGYYISR